MDTSSSSAAPPPAAVRGRCVARIRLPRAWTAEEDARLESLAKESGSPRSCRDRWRHHLARHVYHRSFTAGDDEELRRLVARYGSSGRWKDIGRAVYGRTSRVMKRRWKEIRNDNDNTKRGGGVGDKTTNHRLLGQEEIMDDDDDGHSCQTEAASTIEYLRRRRRPGFQLRVVQPFCL